MKKLTKYTLSAILGIVISYNANATRSFTLHDVFSGTQPLGSVKVDFNTVVAGTVDLTIASQLGSEFLGSLYLNLNPAYDPDDLAFGFLSKTGTFTNPTISTETDDFKADGDGLYDILFAFSNPPSQRFNNADSITYRLTGITGLVEGSFDFLSTPAGGHGPFKAAAHIQNVGPTGNDSGWIAPNGVPDGGATVMLLGTALACLGALRRCLA